MSHSIELLKELGSKMLWIDNGVKKMYGNTDEVLDKYIKTMSM